ncbi:hyaluronidase B-like isoform X3 [Schistocerca nitens]|uniref:hyaluronidase B-like isoform X3 n=1 Tax=Schistocerca nitens TaxID=7011 RepID=UPI0021189BF2|nr:hyaluronidase B-like isoform X3 [Schistocerca nitens]
MDAARAQALCYCLCCCCWPLLLLADRSAAADGSFSVVWNVPTFMCRRYWSAGSNPFSTLTADWDIEQNARDNFRGDKVTILYDPGWFPALLKDSSGKLQPRNGGAPQAGNLSAHLAAFSAELDQLVPDQEFAGIGVIDMESWRPVWKQLFGSYAPYPEFSRKLVRSQHPFWSKSSVEKAQARHDFEKGAREFMETTLELARQQRPLAQWGYYAYPYCFNYREQNCSRDVEKQNDGIQWLFDESTALFPSLYLSKSSKSTPEHVPFMLGRLLEARRVAQRTPRIVGPRIYPYVWYRYHDSTDFLTHEDLYNSLAIPKNLGMNGAIIWGSSKDVNSKKKCEDLANYVKTELGPTVKNLMDISNMP